MSLIAIHGKVYSIHPCDMKFVSDVLFFSLKELRFPQLINFTTMVPEILLTVGLNIYPFTTTVQRYWIFVNSTSDYQLRFSLLSIVYFSECTECNGLWQVNKHTLDWFSLSITAAISIRQKKSGKNVIQYFVWLSM